MQVFYVPVLKGKEGEYGALEELHPECKDVTVPLIEVPSVPYDYANERPARSLDEHVAGVAERLSRSWAGRMLYLHMPWFGSNGLLEDGTPAVARVLRDCAGHGVYAVPVVGTSTSPACLQAIHEHLRQSRGGFCVRLVERDFDEEGDVEPSDQLGRLLDAIGISRVGGGDLILDLGDIGVEVGRATLVARSVLSAAPRIREWRRVVLAAASFPENLSDVSAATTSRLQRLEWQLWTRLQRRPKSLPRALVFGDYAIAHPVPTELDPRTMRMSASIRYTTPDEWLIVKGRNVRQYGFDQYYELARELAKLPEYSGESFSWGDAFIARCARGDSGPGNATTWRKVGTNHHLTLVARELSASVPPAS
jgi:hypothetical protein